MATIRDVAKRAGVAPITVSRVVNNSGYVSDKTRIRVEQAIEELGYIPNMLGPSLRFKQTNTLALILTDITNPFWTTVARGAEDAASESQYNLILCNTDESEEKQNQYTQMLLRRQTDGILLVPASSTPQAVELLQRQKVPTVILDRRVPGVEIDEVRSDSEVGGYLATRHLVEMEHRHVALLTGPENVSTAKDRADGFCRALNEFHLGCPPEFIQWGKFTQESGYEATKRLLQFDPRPTALVAGNNFIAIGAMTALNEAGYRVPEDMAIVAFDDLPVALTIEPFFTVVVQPAYEMGYQATQLLISRLAGEHEEGCTKIILSPELVIRRSTGA
ncbi:MAG: LacI family DNA-binding transcriptional regulator [Anaerolineae bacterium]|nr:LacI family DNA-binding transcriptional regulator [Anaerolineae bacterium]